MFGKIEEQLKHMNMVLSHLAALLIEIRDLLKERDRADD